MKKPRQITIRLEEKDWQALIALTKKIDKSVTETCRMVLVTHVPEHLRETAVKS